MIPRRIHQLWIQSDGGDAEPPPLIKQFAGQWVDRHPGFDARIWSVTDAMSALSRDRAVLLSEIASIVRFEAMIADVARLLLTLEFGGYWSDLRITPLESWLSDYEHADLLLAEHFISEFISPNKGVLVNGFFGCAPENEFVSRCLARAVTNVRNRKSSTTWEVTGPKVFMDVRDDILKNGGNLDAVIIPNENFWGVLVANQDLGLGSTHWSIREQIEPMYKDNAKLADTTPVWRYKYLKKRGITKVECDASNGEVFIPQASQAETFAQICKVLMPKYICDIGSLNGNEAKLFVDRNPESCVIAFEANPENFFRFCLSDHLLGSRVAIQHLAISNVDGIVDFNLPKTTPDVSEQATGDMLGMGSLFLRPDIPFRKTYKVVRQRLDTFFSVVDRSATFCLWIDVEGHSKEVIEGALGLINKIMFIKLELENHPYWAGQALDVEVIKMMDELGFDMIVRSDPKYTQYDALFIRRDAYNEEIMQIITDNKRENVEPRSPD